MSQTPPVPSLLSGAVAPGLAPALPLVEELPQSLTAWDAAQRLAGERHLLFLDSPVTGTDYSRYSFVAADPFLCVCPNGRGNLDPFAYLNENLYRFETEAVTGLPPFQGGVAG